ncbi:hypothetical protein bplSymb_SCF02404P005 [Bathymodiolus platifrons methanotrophic gill symbiont]|uniref:hypothetical protein n=1 Tax=Bathymodiolus platifrons methanotrophic gill symbiont TaxID=113268 RepID=UPI000B4203AF|nr:hypothetical protein [Bathymodiolus platifrons methanotrophic gill symbiont]GAW86328.1 hypothetical protein bplSymb_SCF02404P005 [Bathymodiolus platifrons methanotrophic gill symbiont]GFO77883.1 hypothetical protein BPLS_P6604 [Bathymodiolus platifrons methanotrophic gill symbiont]
MTPSNWGGKREGAGRKQAQEINKTRVVRVDEALIPLINDLKDQYKKGCGLNDLTIVTSNQDAKQQTTLYNDPASVSIVTDLQEKILQLEAEKLIIEAKLIERENIGLKLIQERDKEHLKAVHADSKVESLKSSCRYLKYTYDELLHREYDCMAITGTGERCSKPAKVDTIQNRLMIRVCLQHKKLAENNKR